VRGLRHFALICSDVRATIDFYQGLLEFPLTEILENRDYAGPEVEAGQVEERQQVAVADVEEEVVGAGLLLPSVVPILPCRGARMRR
jgi:catechol 2,3-dioxygenase-like lactoylglutathione lyase family enzyme